MRRLLVNYASDAPRWCLRLALALVLSATTGFCVYYGLKYAYAHHMLSYDITDGHGHGPDLDSAEGRAAYASLTARRSQNVGLTLAAVSFTLPFWFARVKRRHPN